MIGGTGNLTQTGGGLLTLLGTNNYLGSTTISTGTLQVGNGIAAASSLGTGPLTDNSQRFRRPGAASYTGVISGSGSLTQASTGLLTLTGSNGFLGAVTISAGSLQIGNGGSGASIGSTSGVLDNGSLDLQPRRRRDLLGHDGHQRQRQPDADGHGPSDLAGQ